MNLESAAKMHILWAINASKGSDKVRKYLDKDMWLVLCSKGRDLEKYFGADVYKKYDLIELCNSEKVMTAAVKKAIHRVQHVSKLYQLDKSDEHYIPLTNISDQSLIIVKFKISEVSDYSADHPLVTSRRARDEIKFEYVRAQRFEIYANLMLKLTEDVNLGVDIHGNVKVSLNDHPDLHHRIADAIRVMNTADRSLDLRVRSYISSVEHTGGEFDMFTDIYGEFINVAKELGLDYHQIS